MAPLELLPPVAGKKQPLEGHVFKPAYPMYVISVKILQELSELLPHQEAKQQGLVTKHSADLSGRIIGISHQWLSHSEPDPEGVHLKTLQGVLKRMLEGKWSIVEFYWLYAVALNAKSMKFNWKAGLPEAYIWMDYISMPQITCPADADCVRHAAKAVISIPAYLERCTVLMVLAPPCRHKDTGKVCSYATWRSRGWCRTELLACQLASKEIPLMVCTGVNATPFLVHMCDGPRLSVGCGTFSCCTLDHTYQGRPLPCDRATVHSIVRTMLRAKIQLLRLQGSWADACYWTMLQETMLKGLPPVTSEAPLSVNPTLATVLAEQERREQTPHGTSAAKALAHRLNWGEQDEAHSRRTGINLLTCAALADDAAAIRELVAEPWNLDPNLRLKKDFSHLAYMAKGYTPIIVASCFASPETLDALLESRADPSHVGCKGVDVMMTAGCRGRPDNIDFWLQRFPQWDVDRKGLDMGIPVSAVTCISGMHKATILNSLFEARAAVENGKIWGRQGLLLALVATNEDSDQEALNLLLKWGCDPNTPWRPHNLLWSGTLQAASLVSRCCKSRVLMELSMMPGSTPLHFAAKRGDVDFVRLLLAAGAKVTKNNAGHTPLDVARRFFGDHVPKMLEDALEESPTTAGVLPSDEICDHAATSDHAAVNQARE